MRQNYWESELDKVCCVAFLRNSGTTYEIAVIANYSQSYSDNSAGEVVTSGAMEGQTGNSGPGGQGTPLGTSPRRIFENMMVYGHHADLSLVAAHRGLVGPGVSENLRPAVQAAVNNGIELVSLDVQLSLLLRSRQGPKVHQSLPLRTQATKYCHEEQNVRRVTRKYRL